MSEVEGKPRPLDNRYFQNLQREIDTYVMDREILPRRQIEIARLSDAMSEEEITYSEARKKGRLSEDEESLLVTLVQTKSEINRAIEEEILSAEDAKKWKKKFGFKKEREKGIK